MIRPPMVVSAVGDVHGSAFHRVLIPMIVGDALGTVQLRMLQDGTRFFPIQFLAQMKPDAILFHRSHTKEQRDYMEDLKKTLPNILRVYTIDDWVEKIPDYNPLRHTVTPESEKEVNRAIKLCDRLIVTNEVLANVYGYKSDTYIIPNYLPQVFWNQIYQQVPRSPRKINRPRIGWSGAAQHAGDLRFLREVADILGDSVTWVFQGMVPDGFSYDNAEIHDPVVKEQYPSVLYRMDLDLALAPLVNNEFNKAKSNLRVLEYAACGYAILASDVKPYQDTPVQLLPFKAEAWAAAITEKIKDLDKLKAEGESLKKWVWENYKLEDHLNEYSAVFDKAGVGCTPISKFSLENKIDVIVSVHKNKTMVGRCLESVFKSLPLNNANVEIVVINNASTESELVNYLKELETQHKITLITRATDDGYIEAINQGIQLHDGRDVITVNSDTIVNGNWIDRLVKVGTLNPRTATVTPLSNNTTITSYPDPNGSELKPNSVALYDSIAKDLDFPVLSMPTCIGTVCLYKRTAFNELGLFDSNAFGRGYGEENDWSMRALKKHWNHAIAHNVYIGHEGAGTFGAEKDQLLQLANQTLASRWQNYFQLIEQWTKSNPLMMVRQSIDLAIVREVNSTSPKVLYISHSLGGGLETYLKSKIDSDKNVVVLRCDNEHNQYARFEIPGETYHNLPAIDTRLSSLNAIVKYLQDFNVKSIAVQTTFGYEYNFPLWIEQVAKLANIPYTVMLHDYWSTCPRLRMINPYSFCGEPTEKDCDKCIIDNGAVLGQVDIRDWRKMYDRLLQEASEVSAPSLDVANRIKKYLPDLTIKVVPHEPGLMIGEQSAVAPYQEGTELNVVVLGVLTIDKGSLIVAQCAKYCEEHNIPIRFTVFGRLLNNMSGLTLINPSPKLTINGEYEDANIINLLKTNRCNVGFIPSIWPETYSYTLSILLKAGILPIAFDLGAIAERIKSFKFGKLIPFDKHDDIKYIVNTIWEARYESKQSTLEIKRSHLSLVPPAQQQSAK